MFKHALRALKAWSYATNRRILAWLTHPDEVGAAAVPARADIVYVLHTRALTDLIALDIVATRVGLPRPVEYLEHNVAGQRRVLCLNRASNRLLGKHTMQQVSPGLERMLQRAVDEPERNFVLVPVTTIWGRIPHKENSIMRLLISDQWTTTSRLRRFVTVVFNRRDILVQFGAALPLHDIVAGNLPLPNLTRRTARLLRRRFANQRRATLGPDLSHQRTLVAQIVRSRNVTQAIEQAVTNSPATPSRARRKLVAKARNDARSIASNMSYTGIQFLDRLLRFLWTRMYDGVTLNGIDRVRKYAEEHTLIYVPCHRSHVDYLLLSYLLYHNGLSLPHIAAGDNLNLPVIGPLLRRGGAFFMRRRFRDDPVYAAVFSEYLYQVYRRGHSVEFFIEGGRTRTGRLLRPQLGMLSMTLDHHLRGLPKPLVFLPVYVGYERLIESNSYLEELRGAAKQSESLGGFLRSLRLLRQSFGRVTVNVGQPLPVADFMRAHQAAPAANPAQALGRELAQRINAAAHMTPMNLIALVTLATPRIAIDEAQLRIQLDSLLALLHSKPPGADYTLEDKTGSEIIEYAEKFDMLDREVLPAGDIMSHDPANAVLMTWYRNNVLHLLALPSLIASLVYRRHRPLSRSALQRMVNTVYPYLSTELMLPQADPGLIDHWLQVMLTQGLLLNAQLTTEDGEPAAAVAPPPDDSAARFRLQTTARIIMQSLERLYIVIALLHRAGQAGIDRASLEQRCNEVAQRMSRLHGLNAPEFFDARLIRQFIEQLLAREVLSTAEDGRFTYTDAVPLALKVASTVLDDDFRNSILRS